MAHLSIHGIEIECSSSDWEPVELGELTRSLNGAPRSTKRTRKRDHRFTSDVGGLLLEDAELLRALITGEGHSWAFESSVANGGLYSSRKVVPTSATGSITSGSATGVYGKALFAVSTSYIEWPIALSEGFTLLFWRDDSGGLGAFAHYLLRGTVSGGVADAWVDGSPTADPGIFYTGSGGSLVLDCSIDDEWIDDLVALPYAVPDDWVDALYTYHQSNAWSALPYVKASGPGVPSSGLTALGEVYAGRRVPLRESDGTFTTGEVFDFKLMGA